MKQIKYKIYKKPKKRRVKLNANCHDCGKNAFGYLYGKPYCKEHFKEEKDRLRDSRFWSKVK